MNIMAQTLKEASKNNYELNTQNPGIELLTFGVLQRIADSLEIITVKYNAMEDQIKKDQQKKLFLNEEIKYISEELRKAHKSNSALRGHLKRIKNGPKKTNL